MAGAEAARAGAWGPRPGSVRAAILACGFAVAGAVALAACGVGAGATLRARTEVCPVVRVTYRQLMVPDHETFTSLVLAKPTRRNQGSPASLVLSRGRADLGPYGPAIDFLIARYRAWHPSFRDRELPRRTSAVLASARRLDADLADGLCT